VNDGRSVAVGASPANGNGLGGPTRDWQLQMARQAAEHWWKCP
jgi:hypothetical protein